MKKGKEQKTVLNALLDISVFMNFVETPELILGLIIEECALVTRAKRGMILSYDAGLRLDSFGASQALGGKERSRLSAILDRAVKDILAEKKNASKILNEEFWRTGGARAAFGKAIGRKAQDILLCPIGKKGRFLALAILADKMDGAFSDRDKEGFSVICRGASIALDNIHLVKERLRSERMAAIGETIAGISHCVKNILQGITSASYLLNAALKDEDITTIKEAWEIVNKNTKKITGLVMDMLYYSGERRLEKKRLDPKALIGDVLELAGARLKEKKIALKLSSKGLPCRIKANENGLHRALLNLILNAADACDKPYSFVKLEASFDRPGRRLKIAVSDNGKGISKEDLGRVFYPFFTTKKDKGTGLGLAVTKKMVEEQGGSIDVKSEPGRGARFEIKIPV